MVFCLDKSRQNRRTRNTLYNCIYPLHASAVIKSVQMVSHLLQQGLLQHLAGLAITLLGMGLYYYFLKPQADIPYNRLFYLLGWFAQGALALLMVLFLVFQA